MNLYDKEIMIPVIDMSFHTDLRSLNARMISIII